MAKKDNIDITKTGPTGYRELQKLNNLPYSPIDDEINKIRESVLQAGSLSNPYRDMPQMVSSSLSGTSTPWGESIFDNTTASEEEFLNLGDIRAENLPWFSKIGAGIAKGAILAGTTFLDGTIGSVVGIGTAINEGRWSGLWDNEFSKTMQKLTELSEEVLPNYYTLDEMENPWDHIFSANFIGDKFIKNLGFSIGALYSGGVTASAIKGAGKLAMMGAKRLGATIGTIKNIANTTSIVATGLGAATSAVNEGRIEAINNSKDWYNLHLMLILDMYLLRLQDIEDLYAGTEMYELLIALENDNYQQALGKLNEDRLKMGNMDLLMNLPILMFSNLVLFGKLYANGFKTAKKAFNVVGKPGLYAAETTRLGATAAITKGALSEGLEEISQAAASRVSGDYYSSDVTNFYKAKIDPLASLEILSFGLALALGINETVNDGSAWEEFFIGTLTGFLGVPLFRSVRNALGKLQSPIVLNSGAYHEWKEYNDKINRETEIANYMNNRLASPLFLNYYQGLIRHKKYQNDMDKAALEGNELEFKNAEHALLVSDIIMFDLADKLGDLKQAISEASNTSLEDLESIIVNTTTKTKEGKLIGPFSLYASTDSKGDIVANFGSEEEVSLMADKVNLNKQEILDTIDRYQKIKDDIILNSLGDFTDDLISELTWMRSLLLNWTDRVSAMSSDIKTGISHVIGELDTLLRFKQGLMEFEGTNNKNVTPRYSLALKDVKSLLSLIDHLTIINKLNDKSFAHVLANDPKFTKGLMDQIDTMDDSILPLESKQDIIQKLQDVIKLGKASETYNNKLKEYLSNPQLLILDHINADLLAVLNETEQKNKKLKDSLIASPTLLDFRRAIVTSLEDLDTINTVLLELENNGNINAKNYRETNQYNSEVTNIIQNSDADALTKLDALRLFMAQFNNSEDLLHLANPNSVFIDDLNFFDEDSGGDVNKSATRFQNAQYELLRAMSKVNNDNKFKDRFSSEYKKPVENRKNNITVSAISKSGKVIQGEYQKKTDSDGFTHVSYKGAPGARLRVKSGDFGLTTDEIIGNKDSYQSEKGYNEVLQDLEEGLIVTGAHLRPNGDAFIETDNGIAIEGKAAKVLYNNFFDSKVRGVDKATTGDSQTATIPSTSDKQKLLPLVKQDVLVPNGDITSKLVALENKEINNRVLDQKVPSGTTLFQFYRPAIPELHIEGSKEGDFRSFAEVIAEREGGDYSIIYNHLKNAGVFEYLNQGNLKVGDEIGFMIDPEFEEKVKDEPWHKAPTVFLINKRDGHLVGSLDESEDSIKKYEGLQALIDKVRTEYSNRPKYDSNKTLADYIVPLREEIRRKIGGKEYHKIPNIGRIGEIINLYFSTRPTLVDPERIEEFNKLVANTPLLSLTITLLPTGDGKYIATPTTKVSKIMVGKVPYGKEEKSLSTFYNEKTGKKPLFGIIKNGVLVTNGKIDSNLIVNLVDISQEGRLYLLIPNGAGKHSPVAVRVKHFNKLEFDINNSEVAKTSVAQGINEALLGNSNKKIIGLVNATSLDDVSLAMGYLIDDIYCRDLQVTWFSAAAGDGIVLSKKLRNPDGSYLKILINGEEYIKEEKKEVYFNTNKKKVETKDFEIDANAAVAWGVADLLGVPKDPNTIYNEIIDALMYFNLPILVSVNSINEGTYNENLVKSDVLTSNITEANTKSTWFTTDYLDDNGNIKQAINPASVTPLPLKKVETPVGGKEGAIAGIKITGVKSKKTYYIDNSTMTIRDELGNTVPVTDKNRILFDLAWAQSNYGNDTVSTIMIDNKIITPNNKVLDRTKQEYLEGLEALKVKDAINGVNKQREDKIKEAERTIGSIYENLKLVDKAKTDKDYYYIMEDDGEYHQYSRVHSRIGSNGYLDNTTNKDALVAGLAVDTVVRLYFTVKDVSTILKPNNMSLEAFSSLITRLSEIKSNLETRGERFLADNIVLFYKYPDGTRVAGEVDILAVDKEGNFKIYDVKTSRYSFISHLGLNLFDWTINGTPSTKELILDYINKNFKTPFTVSSTTSTKDYYTLQLSAYSNLFLSQYGLPIKRLAIMPFVIGRSGENINSILSEDGIKITYNPAVNVPLATLPKVELQVLQPALKELDLLLQPIVPIFDSTLELQNPIDRILPQNAFDEKANVGYYIKDGKLHKGYLLEIGTIGGVKVYVTKERDTANIEGKEDLPLETSMYYTVFPNGKLVDTKTNSKTDENAINVIKSALEAKPQKVLQLAGEETVISKPSLPATLVTLPVPLSGDNYNSLVERAVNKKKASRMPRRLRATDLLTKPIWNREEELNWLSRVLPQLSEDDRVRVVKGLIKVAENGATAWGLFDGSVVTLSDIAAEGTTYHEAFHVVFNLLLDLNERGSLLSEYRGKHPNMDDIELEEELAEDFREFVMQGGRDTRSLGRKIIDFFKSLFAKTKYWKSFRPSAIYYFKQINDNKYANSKLGTTDLSRLREEEYTLEMKNILANAPRDELGRLLAPNDKPSNLTERLYALVRTKAFKEWFGDWENNPKDASKVVDENGEPLVVYHTVSGDVVLLGKADFTVFNPNFESDKGYNSSMLYFTDNKLMSESYFNDNRVWRNINEVKEELNRYVGLKNKLIPNLKLSSYQLIENFSKKFGMTVEEYIKDAGYDTIELFLDLNYRLYTTRGILEQINEILQRIDFLNTIIENPNKLVKTRAFFINERNPFIVDARGHNWNELTTKGYNVEDIIKEINEAKSYRDKLIDLAINKYIPNEIAEVLDIEELEESLPEEILNEIELKVNAKYPNINSLESTRSIEQLIANNPDYDGTLIKNVIDWGSFSWKYNWNEIKKTGTVIAVKNPNQIKSATDNIGTFDSSNPDIRYRLADGRVRSLESLRQRQKKDTTVFLALNEDTKLAVIKKGWSIELWDRISKEEREHALRCLAF